MRTLEMRPGQQMGLPIALQQEALSKAKVRKVVVAGVVGGTVEMSKKYIEQRGEIEKTVPQAKGITARAEREKEIFKKMPKRKLAWSFAKGFGKGAMEEVIFEVAKKKPKQEETIFEMAA